MLSREVEERGERAPVLLETGDHLGKAAKRLTNRRCSRSASARPSAYAISRRSRVAWRSRRPGSLSRTLSTLWFEHRPTRTAGQRFASATHSPSASPQTMISRARRPRPRASRSHSAHCRAGDHEQAGLVLLGALPSDAPRRPRRTSSRSATCVTLGSPDFCYVTVAPLVAGRHEGPEEFARGERVNGLAVIESPLVRLECDRHPERLSPGLERACDPLSRA